MTSPNPLPPFGHPPPNHSSVAADGNVVSVVPTYNSLTSAYFANATSIVVFFSVLHYLISNWRKNIRPCPRSTLSPSPSLLLSPPSLHCLSACRDSLVWSSSDRFCSGQTQTCGSGTTRRIGRSCGGPISSSRQRRWFIMQCIGL